MKHPLLGPVRTPLVGVAILAVAASGSVLFGSPAGAAGPDVQRSISAYFGSQAPQWTSAGRSGSIDTMRRTFTDAGLDVVGSDVTSRVESRPSATTYVVTVRTRLTLADAAGTRSRAGFDVRRQVRVDGAGRVVADEAVPDATAEPAGLPAPPDPSSAERPKTVDPHRADKATGFQAAAVKWPINFGAMARYAIEWTDGSALNPAYPDAGNNCANLVSQSLDAANWNPFQHNLSRGSMDNWTYKWTGPGVFSYTWSRANYQERFMRETALRTRLSNIWNAGLGDLLYTDWDPNLRPDGTIDHVMVVTGFTTNGDPRISQQTPWRNNIPLATSIAIANDQGRTIRWYGIRT